MDKLPLIVMPLLPLLMAGLCVRWATDAPARALRASMVAALALALVASVAVVDAHLTLPANRALVLSPIAQFGIELLALVMLGLVLSLTEEPPPLIARWLPLSWLSLTGLIGALLINSLPVAVLMFVAAGLLWAFGVPHDQREGASSVVLRYAAFLSLALPLLLAGFRVAEQRTVSTIGLETLVLALLVPGFGLVLGLVPLHAWTLTVASGAPRAMLFGVLALVQTAGFILLLRTLETYPWLSSGARDVLVLGGALSVLAGGWLALSARRDDPDDWLVYAAIASGGMILVGLGSHTAASAVGVLLLLLARVFALLVLALAPRSGSARLCRTANGMGTLTLAGTPGLAGFPGLWLVLHSLSGPGSLAAQVSVLAGSGLLFATALRRWPDDAGMVDSPPGAPVDRPGPRRAVWLLFAVIVALGLLPGLVEPALSDALRNVFLLR